MAKTKMLVRWMAWLQSDATFRSHAYETASGAAPTLGIPRLSLPRLGVGTTAVRSAWFARWDGMCAVTDRVKTRRSA